MALLRVRPVVPVHPAAVRLQPDHVVEPGIPRWPAVAELVGPQQPPALADDDEAAKEIREVPVADALPVHPADLVVLAVGVVVAPLRAFDLVAHQQHRGAVAQHQRGDRGPAQAVAHGKHVLVVGRALDAAVPAQVVVVAVAVALLVRLVVLVVVGPEVHQREAVMGGDEVDAGPGPPAPVFEQRRRAQQSRRHVPAAVLVAPPIGAHAVAVGVVPLGPARREGAQLVAVRPDVPGLGDQLDRLQHGVLADRVEEDRAGVELLVVAPQRRGEVEAKAVDVALLDPVAQRVHDHLHHTRVAQVHGVAAAGGVIVVARVLGQGVVACVVDAPERERRSVLVALGGVVVDHVEDHLDARLVQALHHELELVDAVAGRDIARCRGVIGHSIVAPVVHQVLLDQLAIIDGGLDGKKLDRRHAQPRQVVDHPRVGQPGEGSADLLRHVGELLGHSLDVGLVDDGLGPAPPRADVLAPGVGGVDDHAFRHDACAVAAVHLQVPALRADPVAEAGVVPANLARQRLGVGVDQQLVRVEAVALPGRVGPVYPVAVKVSRPHVRQIAVPDLMRVFGQGNAGRLAPSLRVEQAEFHLLRVGREQGEVHAGAVPGGAQRVRQPRLNPVGHVRVFLQAGSGSRTIVPRGGSVKRSEA